MMSTHNLTKIFKPKSVAIIGATARKGAVGLQVLKNMLHSGFPGAIYPVNPKRKEVFGLPVLRDVADAPEQLDLAIVCTPAATTPAILRRCGETSVGGVVILAAGFRETGAGGKELEDQLRAEANCWPDMRIVGPNSLGVLSPPGGLNASFAKTMPRPGGIAFVSQSGALCTSVLDWARTANVGFSHFVSIGNAIDVEFADLIDYFATDPATASMVLYVESLTKARQFMSAARAFCLNKPIVVYKAGRFQASAEAAASHMGAIVGVDEVYDAAFQRAGAVRVYEAEELFDCAELLAGHRWPAGPRLGIVTNAGGPGVMAVDELLDRRGCLAQFTGETIEKLDELMTGHWSHGNPVDVQGDADADRFSRASQLVLKDCEVDALLAILCPQSSTTPTATARELAIIAAKTSKPVLAAWMGGESVEEGRRQLSAAGVAVYHSPDRAVRAFGYLLRYVRNRETLYETPRDVPISVNINRATVRRLIPKLSQETVHALSEGQSKALLKAYGVEATIPRLARSSQKAAEYSREIGYPVVLKIQSPDIVHKTEVGGVELGISDSETAESAFNRIVRSVRLQCPQAEVAGVTVQRMVTSPTGVELMVGVKRDPVFGAVMMVGAGGVAVEVMRDFALELPPLNERLATKMLESLRIWPLLKGFRGRAAVDVEKLIETLMRVSYLIADNPTVLELDINPLLATPADVVALDARITLGPKGEGELARPFAHLAIRPYPEEYVQKGCLPNQESVLLRPIKPEDEPLWHELLARTSQRTLWQRFRYLFKESTHELATRFCYIDYDRTMAIVAEVDVDGKKRLVGVGRLVADADHESAEFAVLIEDAWQGKGLGSLLTRRLVEICDGWGVSDLTAETTADNHRMQAIFHKLGFHLTRQNTANEWLYRKSLRTASDVKGEAAEKTSPVS